MTACRAVVVARLSARREGEPASVTPLHRRRAAYLQTRRAAYDRLPWRICTSCRRGTTRISSSASSSRRAARRRSSSSNPSSSVHAQSRAHPRHQLSVRLGLHSVDDGGGWRSARRHDLHDVPTYPGVVMACEAIGALLVTQREIERRARARQANHRLFAVPAGSEREREYNRRARAAQAGAQRARELLHRCRRARQQRSRRSSIGSGRKKRSSWSRKRRRSGRSRTRRR